MLFDKLGLAANRTDKPSDQRWESHRRGLLWFASNRDAT